MKEFTGKVSACLRHSAICNFDCCCQNKSQPDKLVIPQSSILLTPGELKGKQKTDHILITMSNYFGGSLGFCDPKKIDQSKCDPSLNYKPLDCQSYPFFPRLIDGRLVLHKDSRCPLGEKNQKVGLRESDIKGMYFILEDWVNAYKTARNRCNPNSRALEDNRIQKFIESRDNVMGFSAVADNTGGDINIRRSLAFLG